MEGCDHKGADSLRQFVCLVFESGNAPSKINMCIYIYILLELFRLVFVQSIIVRINQDGASREVRIQG